MKSQLINLHVFSEDDFDVEEKVFTEMEQCFQNGTDVNIECLAVEGSWGYYDVTLPSGATIDALDGYHLKTIHDLKVMLKEQR